MKRNSGLVGLGLVAAFVLAAGGTVLGAEFTWTNTASGNWSSSENWLGGVVATGAANTAVFPVASGGVVTMDQDSDIGALRFPAGSLFTIQGTGTLSNHSVEVEAPGQSVLITAPVVSPSEFFKTGQGTAEVSNVSVPGSTVTLANGTLRSRALTASAVTWGVNLGHASTLTNGTVEFLLTTDGDYVEKNVNFSGWEGANPGSHRFDRILGGANTNGNVYYNWISADSGYLNALNDLFFTAAAGGSVKFDNIGGNSACPVVKTGPGTVKVWTLGGSDTDRSWSGGTIVRNGTLYLNEDDVGTTTNGAVLPNGRTSHGAGGSLGYNDFANPVQLGDSRYVLTGSGDIWGTADSFHCASGALTNSGQIVAQVRYLQYTADWAKAGLMIRETLDSYSKSVMILVTAGSGGSFQWRDGTGGETTNVSFSAAPPKWLKLVRAGDLFTGYVSDDGRNWTEAGSATVSMSSVVQVGLVASSHETTLLGQAVFENVAGLPAGWASRDVGSGLAGSAWFDGTQPADELSLLAASPRWIGHALQVNRLGKSVSIGLAEAGSCTFAGPVTLARDVILTAPAGGTALFSGGIIGSGNVIKTGAGVVKLGGTNTFSGLTVVSNGQVQVVSPIAAQGLIKAGPGVMTIAAPQDSAGPVVVAEGLLRLGQSGLYEGRVLQAGVINTNDANPHSSIQMSTRYANSTDSAPWVNNSTYIYSGRINNPYTNTVAFTFAEQFDDAVQLKIDGVQILYDTTWNNQAVNTVTLTPGWHTFELRLGQGEFGVGPANGGVDSTTGLGVAYSNRYTGGWAALTDTTWNFFDTGDSTAAFLSTGTTVSVASGAILDLAQSTQTVAGVSGTGTIIDGQLGVTGAVVPAGTNSIGSLTVNGNLVVGSSALCLWDFTAASGDRVAVGGTLTLPASGTLVLNSLDGSRPSSRLVLFTFGSYSGPTLLSGWTVPAGTALKVDLASKQVVLTALGTLLMIN